ncbi:polysaccharide lyase [Actinomycetospora lutea]|uniref:polysaccharide lyase n=1 Tax=Actinomycetospora lutea TaxID=663604 RepID=UPI00236530E6|nr:polysaccharide lyase [Actinomycetospora lutea]MDD7940813.1 polysaccharide lyase [Actinomycetospora lutea]
MDMNGRRRIRPVAPGRGRRVAGAALGWAVLGLAGGVVGAPSAGAAPPAVPTVEVVGNPVFVGDYETGDFGQWGICQTATINSDCAGFGGDRTMRIVTDDVRQGRYAAQFDLAPGDVPDFGGGERAEVRSDAEGAVVKEGDERWYQWSMKFPADFQDPTGVWFIVMQWHAGDGSPPLAINISNEGTVDIGGDGLKGEPRPTIGPVRRGEWVDYTLHVKFSRSSEDGFVEAWENESQTVPRTARASMTSDSNYLKQGIYRDTGPATSVRIDGLRVTAPGVALP